MTDIENLDFTFRKDPDFEPGSWGILECQDRDIFVRPQLGKVGSRRTGWEFIVYRNGRAFGFMTAGSEQKDESVNLDDGIRIWYFDEVCCEISSDKRTRLGRSVRVVQAYETGFEDEAEQDAVFRILAQALKNYGAWVGKKPSPGQMKFTKRVKKKIAKGDYLK